ncbi:hypothetical protein N665_1125s0003 [Sinapis alba]|nr:hypothetical protein N665_1125s0003 [Sinapis alba]
MEKEGVDKTVQEASKGLQAGSWVKAVQGKKVLTKYEMEIQMEEGIGSVNVPDEVFKDAAPLWDDFLIGRFLDKAPHIAKVHAIVNKIWALSDKTQMIDVYEINSTTMKFRISNPITRNRVIRRAMWNIAEVPVVMAKWSPLTEDIKQETHSIPLWVHMKNIPMDMFSWKGLSFISSSVGVPVRLHPETEQCINLKVAKVFVKADLSKDMPRSMNFNFQGKKTLVEYTYPWLPPKCTYCEKWGHYEKVCKGKKEEKEGAGGVERVNDLNHRDGKTEKSELDVSSSVEGSPHKGVELVAESVIVSTGKAGREGSIMEVLEKTKIESSKKGEGEKIWLEVSPGKSCHTPIKAQQLEFGQVSILSKSRFSVLSQEEEDGEIAEKEEEKEALGEMEAEIAEGSDKENGNDKLREAISEEEEINLRKYLPRGSKSKHKFISDVSVQRAREEGPSDLNKKKKPRKAK